MVKVAIQGMQGERNNGALSCVGRRASLSDRTKQRHCGQLDIIAAICNGKSTMNPAATSATAFVAW